jgi:hypothetical protein
VVFRHKQTNTFGSTLKFQHLSSVLFALLPFPLLLLVYLFVFNTPFFKKKWQVL